MPRDFSPVTELPNHISRQFNRELGGIYSKVLDMGGLVEDHLKKVLDALFHDDVELAEYVAVSDHKVNELELEIDRDCTEILLRRQPAAGDLRLVLSVSRTTIDLERIGDEVKKVGRIATKLIADDVPETHYLGVVTVGHRGARMLRGALDAFARTDSAAAVGIVTEGRKVDHDSDAVMRQLITLMMEDPRCISRALEVVMAMRSLQRVGDHANNICENLIYMVEGRDVRHRSIYDDTP